METGSSSKSRDNAARVKGGGATSLGSMLPKIEPFLPKIDHNPKELRSWAKRTGFVSDYSGTSEASASEKNDRTVFDLEKGLESRKGGSAPKETDPVLGRTRPHRGIEIEPVLKNERDGVVRGETERRRPRDEARGDERKVGLNGSASGIVNGTMNGNEVPAIAPAAGPKKEHEVTERDAKTEVPDGEEPAHGEWRRPPGMKCGLRENPGFG